MALEQTKNRAHPSSWKVDHVRTSQLIIVQATICLMKLQKCLIGLGKCMKKHQKCSLKAWKCLIRSEKCRTKAPAPSPKPISGYASLFPQQKRGIGINAFQHLYYLSAIANTFLIYIPDAFLIKSLRRCSFLFSYSVATLLAWDSAKPFAFSSAFITSSTA